VVAGVVGSLDRAPVAARGDEAPSGLVVVSGAAQRPDLPLQCAGRRVEDVTGRGRTPRMTTRTPRTTTSMTTRASMTTGPRCPSKRAR
jgi:hypothetical protein